MPEDKKYNVFNDEKEDNSFFDFEYEKYRNQNEDSCAAGTMRYEDITLVFGMEETAMLKDYDTMQMTLSETTRDIQNQVDKRITQLTGKLPGEVRELYEFDPDELTIGQLIEINKAFEEKQSEINEDPTEPYLTTVYNAAGEDDATSKIAVIAVPTESIVSDETPFLSVDDIIS